MTASTPCAAHNSFSLACSASVSALKRLTDTTAGTPNRRRLSRWRCKVGEPGFERRDIFLPELVARHAAMHLQRAHGRDDDRRIRLQPGLAAFDVDEFLGPEIGAEPGLGDDVIGELQRRRRRDHRVAAMGDIGERPAMDEGRVVLQGLHEVRRDRVLQQHRHRARRLEIARRAPARARGSGRR